MCLLSRICCFFRKRNEDYDTEKDVNTEVSNEVDELKILVNNLQERVDSLDDELYIVKKSLLLTLKNTPISPIRYNRRDSESKNEDDSEDTDNSDDDSSLDLDEDIAEEKDFIEKGVDLKKTQ